MKAVGIRDAEKSLPSAARMLSGHETRPRSEMPVIGKLGSVYDRGDKTERLSSCPIAMRSGHPGRESLQPRTMVRLGASPSQKVAELPRVAYDFRNISLTVFSKTARNRRHVESCDDVPISIAYRSSNSAGIHVKFLI